MPRIRIPSSREAVLVALLGLPLVAAGQWVGVLIRPRVQGKRFEQLVYVLLGLSAVSVSWSGLFG